jgi:hypothetical protein
MLTARFPKRRTRNYCRETPMDGRQSASKTGQMAAAVIGNVLEWYDFIVFGLLTVRDVKGNRFLRLCIQRNSRKTHICFT